MTLRLEADQLGRLPSGKRPNLETPIRPHQKPRPSDRYKELIVPLCPFVIRIKTATKDKGM